MTDDKPQNTNSDTERETIVEFPCNFPVKAMGSTKVELAKISLEIAQKHVPGLTEEHITVNMSKGGKFISVTLNMHVHSQAQLDAVYIDLTACEHIVMVL